MEHENILSVRNITKSYPGVKALDDVSINIRKGELHALVGENGAGKSTLIKILTGAVVPDGGEIEFAGVVHCSFTPHEALDLGIAAIYQEFNLVPFLTAAENVFLGKEVRLGPFLRNSEMNAKTAKLFEAMRVELNPSTIVKDLSVAYQQVVEIAKALTRDVGILIMDEPSAALTTNEVEHLFKLVATLREQGVTIIYVSHKMSEVLSLADRITVLRDGKLIETLNADQTNRSELINLMVGRELGPSYPSKAPPTEDVLLEARKLKTSDMANEVSFKLHKGEILGLAGLVGAGRTQLVRAMFGADVIESGEIIIDQKAVAVTDPSIAVALGIGLVPEDRKQHGILAHMSVKDNISYSTLKSLSLLSLIKDKEERKVATTLKEKLNVRTPDLAVEVANLSGGNQQKVVLAKWLAAKCRILLLDEPTRGIDVGAKQEIYGIIKQLAEEGTGIIFISSEMPELLGMADRILVMREGALVGAFEKGEATQEALLNLAMAD